MNDSNYIKGMEVVMPCEPDVTKKYKLVMKYTADCQWIFEIVEDVATEPEEPIGG